MSDQQQHNKQHKAPRAGKKFDKKEKERKKKLGVSEEDTKTRKEHNVKAFGMGSDATDRLKRSLDKEENHLHRHIERRDYFGQAPKLVAVVGPPKTGKSTLIKSLVKHFTKQKLDDVCGPVTLRSGKSRTTFFECPNDINAMIDLGKVVDLVLLVIDASYGFEMETFEFLNILQVHGFTRVMGVMTHLDRFKEGKQVRKLKKTLKHRFWTEVCPGAKTFYISGLRGGLYTQRETVNLARYVSLVKPRPLVWRTTHPSVLVDRFEDITDPEKVKQDPTCNRHGCFYGYVRGTFLRESMGIHIAGCGDFTIGDISSLSDPLPPIDTRGGRASGRRTLNEKSRGVYGPMSDLGDLFYDKDAVYVTVDPEKEKERDRLNELLQNKKRMRKGAASGRGGDGEDAEEVKTLVETLQSTVFDVDSKLRGAQVKLLSGAKSGIKLNQVQNDSDDEDDEDILEDDDVDGDDDDDAMDDESGDELDEVEPVRSSAELIAAARAQGRRAAVPVGGSDKAGASTDADDIVYDDDESDAEDDNDGDTQQKSKKSRADTNDDNDDNDDMYFMPGLNKQSGRFEEQDSDNESDLDELFQQSDEAGAQAARWKQRLFESNDTTGAAQSSSMYSKKLSLQDLVYDDAKFTEWKTQQAASSSKQQEQQQQTVTAAAASSSSGGKKKNVTEQIMDLFGLSDDKPQKQQKDVSSSRPAAPTATSGPYPIDDEDFTKEIVEPEDIKNDWDDAEVRESIRNKFVTGDWTKRRNKNVALPVHGDPEDLGNDGYMDDEDNADADDEVDNDNDNDGNDDEDGEDMEAIRRKRAQKKAQFDAEHDKKKDKTLDNVTTVRELSELMKKQDPQSQLNQSEFEGMSQADREKYQGFAVGTYVRIEIYDLPCEFVENVDFHNPILLGGLRPEETRMGFIRLRLKKHRWHPRILKNKDPLIFSIGWRRFQSIPLYCIQDDNGRHRQIKYTPEHTHCIAAIYGPFVPQNTGVVAFQTVSSKVDHFRVSATGYTMELDHDFSVVKKLKLTGHPKVVKRNTSVITGMFNSDLEVAKFEGAKLATVSGLRGQLKKAVKRSIPGVEPGDFRATFEDKILMSDIVILRTWYPIELLKFYNPVLNHLTRHWLAMRTVGQLRKLKGLSIPQKEDSHYKEITKRSTKGHGYEFIPKPKLLKSLPFKHQNKKEVQVTGVTDDLSKYIGQDAPVHKLTSALLSDKEVERINTLKKMEAIDAERRKKNRLRHNKYLMEQYREAAATDKDTKKRQREVKSKRYIQETLRRVKKAKYAPEGGDNQ